MHAEIADFKGNRWSSDDYKQRAEKDFHILQKGKFRIFLQWLRIFQQTKCGWATLNPNEKTERNHPMKWNE